MLITPFFFIFEFETNRLRLLLNTYFIAGGYDYTGYGIGLRLKLLFKDAIPFDLLPP